MKKDFSIVFIPTFSCNSNCSHCFEEITPSVFNDKDWMSYFRNLKDFAADRKLNRLLIYWQGGEVMNLGHEIVKNGLQNCAEIFNGSGVELEHHLQTNLLLYDSNWSGIIHEYFRGGISSSLDYPNLYRTTEHLDQNRYSEEWRKKKNEAEKDGLVVNLITLPNVSTIEKGASAFYNYFKDEIGVRNVQINFPFTGVSGKHPFPLDLDKFGDFMINLYDVWVDSDRYLNLNPFFALENKINKNDGRLPCCWSYNCADYLFAVAPDGEVGQCDCWVSTHKDYSFGTLGKESTEEIMESQQRELFLDRPIKMIHDQECGECSYWMICFGGCPIRAFTCSGDIYKKDQYCPVYKRIFSTVFDNAQKGVAAHAKK